MLRERISVVTSERLAHYVITGHLGSGGMGDVYQATDTKLGRSVALKFLPDAFAHDVTRAARFDREAKTLASLNHPHIAAIHGLEECDGRTFLVMEFLPGETLAERIDREPMAWREALGIARQIAEALEAAHDKGVVHRDLKPANVKVTPDGHVKVLDFGLAKLVNDETGSSGDTPAARLADSPTLTAPVTHAGVILGTAAYMAPEQARGRPVDRRADIFAFGCVLYEMLTGRRAFEGESAADVVSCVLQRDPDWTRLPADVPPSIQRLLRLCLEKDPKQRRQAAGDVRIDLEHARTEPPLTTPAVPRRRSRTAVVAPIAGAAVVITALAIPAVVHFRETPPAEMRLQIVTPPTIQPLHFALSPDGRHIVFVAAASPSDPTSLLYVRALDSTDAKPLPGSDGARYPFWSPDSKSVGFFASGQLHRIDIGGGPAQALASAPGASGGAWNIDGTILFAPNTVSPLLRLPASGGEAVAVTKVDSPHQLGHRLPSFLPGGRQFLFFVQGEPDASGIYLGSFDGASTKRLTAADTAGAYLAPDRIAFVRQGALVARRLDAARGELIGDPVTLVASVGDDRAFLGGFSVSATGMLAHRTGTGAQARLTWFERTGKNLEQLAGGANGPELSPDERMVTFDRTVQGNRDVWILDLVRGAVTRFTVDAAVDGYPIWSPDGSRIAFESTRNGTFDIWIKAANGSGAEHLLLETPDAEYPLDWSKDGGFLLYQKTNLTSVWDLFALPMTGSDRTPIAVANTPFTERMAEFSPDGRWIAYETNESGRAEIVAREFPASSGTRQVSTGGGTSPRWSADGRAIYFVAPDLRMMAVAVTTTGATLAAGKPVALFPTQIVGQAFKSQYAISRDGRFLINSQIAEQATTSPITLVLNWKP